MRDGVNILILSDRGVSPDLAPIPMLLATGAVHHHLIREELRTRCGIVCETRRGARGRARGAADRLRRRRGESRTSRFQTIEELVERRHLRARGRSTRRRRVKNFVKASDKGLLKTFAKMGISTLQ